MNLFLGFAKTIYSIEFVIVRTLTILKDYLRLLNYIYLPKYSKLLHNLR